MTRRQFIACVAYVVALPLLPAEPPLEPAPWLCPDDTGWSPLDQARIWLSFAPWASQVGFDAGGRRWTAERHGRGWRLLDRAGRVCHTHHGRRP